MRFSGHGRQMGGSVPARGCRARMWLFRQAVAAPLRPGRRPAGPATALVRAASRARQVAAALLAFAALLALPLQAQAQASCTTEEDVRLIDGDVASEGSVQICHNSEWRHVCDDDWERVDANVVCRQLGYSEGARQATKNSTFNKSTLAHYWLDDVACTGSESKLADCSHPGWGVHNCQFGEKAGVRCTLSPELSVAPARAVEGEPLEFAVTLSSASGSAVTVTYAATGVTATAGADYTAPGSGATLTIPAGDTTATITVATLTDTTEHEGGETLTLTLSNPQNATLATATATGRIYEPAPPGSDLMEVIHVWGGPKAHDGKTSFTYTIMFTWPGAVVTSDSFEITGGAIDWVERYDPESQQIWNIRITPTGRAPVVMTAKVPSSCSDMGAICAVDGRMLARDTTFRIPPNSLLQRPLKPLRVGHHMEGVGTNHADDNYHLAGYGNHQGRDTTFDLVFSDAISGGGEKSPGKISDDVAWWRERITVGVPGSIGTVIRARYKGEGVAPGSEVWAVTVRARKNALAEVTVPKTTGACTDAGAICTEDGRKLRNRLRMTMRCGSPSLCTGEFVSQPAGLTQADPLTIASSTLPSNHGGSAFTFRLTFSEAVTISAADLGDALAVSGGEVTGVTDVDSNGVAFDITIAPAGTGSVSVSLPALADCAADGAVCTAGGTALSAGFAALLPYVARSAPPPPLTGSFVSAPAEHDGAARFALELKFSAVLAPQSRAKLRSALTATGGTVAGVRRIGTKRDRWRIRVRPSGNGAVTLSLASSGACGSASAICADDGRALSGTVGTTIIGPPGLSVADAQVTEAANATLAFAVTLSRAASDTVTVTYATSDGTATAGSDYTQTDGTLTFAAGDTVETVSVPVLDDAHDEGTETLTLTLSSPSGAYLADGSATGKIVNSDRMPQAWIARFGRTVADQVLEAVEARMGAPRVPGVELSLAGQQVGGAAAQGGTAAAGDPGLAGRFRGGTDPEQEHGFGARTVSERDLLTGSSFALTGGTQRTGAYALWGRGAVTRFDGREGELTLDGEVTGSMLGADWSRGAVTTGLVVSHSRGEGSYRGVSDDGGVSSSLTGLYPWGRYALGERLSVWGVAGYGEGSLTLTPADRAAIRTDLDLTMAAAGLRGVLLQAPETGGLELAAKTDAMGVRTGTARARDSAGGRLEAAAAEVTRVRLGLEGSRPFRFEGGASLTPSLEIGVRRDGGDAETGSGTDIGGGLAWSDPQRGLSAELRGRGLLSHAAEGFRERGFSGALSWDPTPETGRGLSLTMSQSVGVQATGGMNALLERDTLAGLTASDDPGSGAGGQAQRRFQVKLGYGLAAFGGGFTATPETGFGFSGEQRHYSLGWRLTREDRNDGSFELSLEAWRQGRANDNTPPEHGIGLRATARW